MPNQEIKSLPAVLVLEDGMVFHGRSFGMIGTTSGELCFNTGMTGYQEVFTDPSYYGQVLIMNNVHTGNYGVKAEDVESNTVKIKGLIGRNLEEKYSRIMASDSLQNYLLEQKVVAIEDVDTRALVTHIREKGAMNCIISSENLDVESLKEAVKKVPSMEGLELASLVSTNEVYHLGDPNAPIRIAVLDFGVKRNIIQCIADRGAYVRVHPLR
ncbi:MAG: carbamoyl-phosphate synthase domain-containing protein [bacterium]